MSPGDAVSEWVPRVSRNGELGDGETSALLGRVELLSAREGAITPQRVFELMERGGSCSMRALLDVNVRVTLS